MKIAIAGNYGAKNLGDEMILEGLIKTLKSIDPDVEITVLSADPEETKKKHGVKAVQKFPAGIRSAVKSALGEGGKTKKAVKECDYFILGGGGLFSNLTKKAYLIWGIQARRALRYKKPLIMYGQSVGPVEGKFRKKLIEKLFNKAIFTAVRDTESKEELKRLGVKGKIHLIPDLVFYSDTEKKETSTQKEENSKKIIVCPRQIEESEGGVKDDFKEKVADFLNWLVDGKKYKIVFANFQTPEDEILSKELKERIGKKEEVKILSPFKSSKAAYETFSEADFVLGMRLHSILTAIKTETPFIAINYAPKVKNFLEYTKLKDLIVETSSPDFKNKFKEVSEQKEKIIERLRIFNEQSKKRHEEIIKELAKTLERKT